MWLKAIANPGDDAEARDGAQPPANGADTPPTPRFRPQRG
jgi:hypothetical protein